VANVLLQWTDNAVNEDDYSIEHQLDGGGYSFLENGTLPADTVQYVHESVADGIHDYRVFCSNAFGDSTKLEGQIVVGVPEVYVLDTFTKANGTPVIGSVPDTGSAWFENSTDKEPPTIENSAFRSDSRNRCGIDPGVADHKTTVDLVSLNRGSGTRAIVGVRNISTTTAANWEFRCYVNNTSNPRVELVEDGAIRDDEVFPDNYEVGVLTVTCQGQTITCNYKSVSHDATVTYGLATYNQLVTGCSLGSNGLSVMDNYKIEALS
jgi:hypothetical protein